MNEAPQYVSNGHAARPSGGDYQGHWTGEDCSGETTNCLKEVVITPNNADRLTKAIGDGADSIQAYFETAKWVEQEFPNLLESANSDVLKYLKDGGVYGLKVSSSTGGNAYFLFSTSISNLPAHPDIVINASIDK